MRSRYEWVGTVLRQVLPNQGRGRIVPLQLSRQVRRA
jgi:hypothetical protein